MPPFAVALILVSCVLHAAWNLLVKRAHDKESFTALYLVVSPVLFAPILLVFRDRLAIPPAGWLCVCVTGCLYAAYFVALGRAYRDGELSYAYPLARGIGPVGTALGAWLFLGERVTVLGVGGITLILAGVLVLQWPDLARLAASPSGPSAQRRHPLAGAPGAALTVGLMYACYSIVDKIAVSRVGIAPAIYIYLTYALSAAIVVPSIVARRGVGALRREASERWASALAVGAMNIGAYLLVLFAMARPDVPVTYVAPLRTGSVLIGVLAGLGALREGRPTAKLSAALLIMSGVALIAWKG